MPAKDRIFISPEEAIDAIRTDFNLYAPQTRLFLKLGPLILGDEISLVEDSRNNGIWIATPGRRRMHRMKKISSQDLGELLCQTLRKGTPSGADLAEICTRVFEAPARAGKGPDGREGIWIETGIGNFQCRQCGRCCRLLDYHDTVSDADYQLWKAKGRSDILQWVGTIRKNGRVVSRRIWIVPGTRKHADSCPWLHQNRKTHLWECLIHDVKPEICRQYPGTFKHGRMTECSALQSFQPDTKRAS